MMAIQWDKPASQREARKQNNYFRQNPDFFECKNFRKTFKSPTFGE